MVNRNNRTRNGPRRNNAGSLSNRPTSNALRRQVDPSINARRSYERYVELARAAALTGDRVETENYYQHAEHFFRLMREKAIPQD
jgi:hypothetical protein